MSFSLFSLFNALVPKDAGSRRVARDVAYGRDARQTLDIYAPRSGSGPWPVLVFIYGGSWMDGDKGNYEFAGRALAALGYVVVIADYRLIPQVEYPTFLDDCANTFGWTMREIAPYGDASRVALMGHSAGAYNAAMLALDPRYRARVPALGQLRCVVGLSGPYDFYPFDGPISLRTFGAVRDPAATQPVHHVFDGAPPMFLGHGGRDELVLPRNGTALANRLAMHGVTVETKVYPSLGHPGPLLALSRPLRGMAPVYADVAAYLSQMLR